MTNEQVKRYYHRFYRWQQLEPHYVNHHENVVQHCHNCGTEFAGNFCPICGQRADVAVMLLVTHFINKRTFNKYRTL